MPPSRFLLRACSLIVAAALAGCFAALARFDPSADEAWMVWATQRLLHGDRLYQDVFSGVTPLAFQFQTALQSLSGPSIALLRALSFVLYALSALLVLATGIALRLSRLQLYCVLVATLLWTVPENSSTYNPWAVLFALAAQYSGIRLFRSGSPARWAAAAGLCAGLAFAAKQNIGLLCLAALLLGLAFSWPRLLPLAAAAFAFAAALPLLPIALAGGLPAFLHYGFFNKTVYAKVAAVPYLDYVYLTPRALWNAFGLPAGTLLWLRSLRYLAPFLLLAAGFGVGKLFLPRHAALRLQLMFTAAALGFVYPRPDSAHIVLCAPFVALSLPLVARLVTENQSVYRFAAGVFGAALLLQFGIWGVMLGQPLPATVSRGQAFSRLYVSADFAALTDAAAQLPAEVFVLHPQASILYLASGARNPTVHDFPLNSAFGADGQERVIQQIRRGGVSAVCLPDQLWTADPIWRGFAPRQLIDYVRTEMQPGPEKSLCQVYRPR